MINSHTYDVHSGDTDAHPDFHQSYTVAPDWVEVCTHFELVFSYSLVYYSERDTVQLQGIQHHCTRTVWVKTQKFSICECSHRKSQYCDVQSIFRYVPLDLMSILVTTENIFKDQWKMYCSFTSISSFSHGCGEEGVLMHSMQAEFTL